MGFGYSNLNMFLNGGSPGQGGMSESEVKKLIQEELDAATAEINKSIVDIETEVSSIEAANKAQDEVILGLEGDVEDISTRLSNVEQGGSGVDEEAVKAIIEEQLGEGGAIYDALEEATFESNDVVRVNTFADLPEEGKQGTVYIVDETDTSYHWSPGSIFEGDEVGGHYDSIAGSAVVVDAEGNQVSVEPASPEAIDDIFK